jgi:hypothetical protein
MKALPQIALVSAMAMLLFGCASSRNSDPQDHCTLIESGPEKLLLAVNPREWGGFWGIHGYIGYEHIGYWAALAGPGPEFINPHFQDNPASFRCIGTITLDREHNKVTLNMRRIVSEAGSPQRTKPHPANGTYSIELIRKAKPDESWF